MPDKLTARECFEHEIQKPRAIMLARARRDVGGNDADDVVMQAFSTALRHERWQEVRAPASWILGVLDNEIKTHKRRAGKIERHEKSNQYIAEWDAAVRRLSDEEGDLVDRILDEEDVAAGVKLVMDAMVNAGLTTKEDFVVLARLRGRADVEIARDLGIEPNAVRSYHSLAVGKIKTAIAAKGENE